MERDTIVVGEGIPGCLAVRELIRHVADAEWRYLRGSSRTVYLMVRTVVYERTRAGLAACRNIRGIV